MESAREAMNMIVVDVHGGAVILVAGRYTMSLARTVRRDDPVKRYLLTENIEGTHAKT
jgi:hypothetical protein